MQLVSLLHSVAAHIPTVIVERNHAVAQTLFADGVEGTTDRFAEPCFSRTVSTFQGAQTAVALVACEHAVFASHNARHQVTVAVGIRHALLVDNSLCRCRHVVPHGVESVFYASNLIERHRSASVALYAADALAGIKVAAKLFGEDVARNQYVINLYYHNVLL